MKLSETCEVVEIWGPPEVFCGKPTVGGYIAMGGGWMALCEEHIKPHVHYSMSADAIRYLQAEGLDPSIVEKEGQSP
jgi:hypothetical protein